MIHTSPSNEAQSCAISRMTCELIAVMATLMTSNLLLGNFSSSIACNIRGRPKAGSGSPIAADSPRTKMRIVPGSLCGASTTG